MAGAVALTIAVAGGSTSSAAPGQSSSTQAATIDGPGMDKAKTDAQNQARTGLIETGVNQGSESRQALSSDPGTEASPDAACVAPCFTDVPNDNTFASFINRLYMDDIVTGYPCGGPGEPCDPQSRPYYRQGAVVTRGQMAKFVDLARHMPGIRIESGYAPIYSVSNVAGGAGLVGQITAGPGAGVAAYGNGSGTARAINGLNMGTFGLGNGAANSVGGVFIGAHDNGLWVGSQQPSSPGFHGLYVVDEMGGFSVGLPGDSALNDSFVGGDLVVEGNCTGCDMVVLMQNTGTDALYPGEVAAMTSEATGPAEMAGSPMVGASRAEGAYSTNVAGVVYYRYVPADASAPEGSKARTGYYDRAATSIAPGEYFGVVTAGTYKEIKVSAEGGAIRVGDLLVAGSTPGTAMKADPKDTVFGSVIGKAMGNLESGEGTIAVMITLK